MEDVKYFLVLEKRLGDYSPVDINRLDICKNFVGNSITAIDCFTCAYSEEEIKSSIERSNIASKEYINGTLKIISDAKHNLKVLTKDVFDVIREFQVNNVELDRDFKNKLFGMYKKVVETTFEEKNFIKGLLDRFKETLKEGNKEKTFITIEELPYHKSRTIYLDIYKVLQMRKENSLRKLEKADE